MKAKTYRFIFSALLICFAAVGKAQTIDGKLYTPFNNYYQWIGGKFNNNLNIPKIAATNGRDTGGIRYNLADSLMYVWTGSQWRVVGAPVDTSSLSSRINERVKYSDTASMLNPYLRKIDTASLSNRINLKQNLINLTTTGTSGNATFNQSTGALNIPNYSTDTTSLSNRINERVKYSDTAAMLAPYLDYVPTLQQVTTAGNTTTEIIKITDNSLREYVSIGRYCCDGDTDGTIVLNSKNSFDSSYDKITISSNDKGFILFKPTNTNSYQMLKPQNLPLRNSNIFLPDSTGILTQRVKVNGTTYNTAANGVIDLGTISSDTTSLSNRINQRVKYTDTAAMLAPYLTAADLPNTDTATVVKAYVTNAEAVTITKGQVVYIFGAQGDRASVKLAKNTSDTFSSKTLGIVRADIAAGQAGWVTTQGQVSGINLGAYSPGDILWLDSVPGGFTKTKPEAPLHGVFVGVVERANPGNGLIYVKPQNGVELDEIHNVLITSPTNNQVLSYTASTGIWENKTVSASIFAYTAQTTTYTAGAEDYVIHCTSGTFSVNLPTAVGITGKVYIIKNSGSGFITIDPNGSQTIDGVTTYTMGQAESVQVISTGSNWITL